MFITKAWIFWESYGEFNQQTPGFSLATMGTGPETVQIEAVTEHLYTAYTFYLQEK